MDDTKLDRSDKVIVVLLIICVSYFGIQIIRFFFDLLSVIVKAGAIAAFVLLCCALYSVLKKRIY